MQSSNLLFALCETLGEGKKFITLNDESKEDEDGSLAAFMYDICYHLTAGQLRIGVHYLLSDVPLQETMPDVIFANLTNGGKTSMFGYEISDFK